MKINFEKLIDCKIWMLRKWSFHHTVLCCQHMWLLL